jgi:hypothetical protein
MEKIPTFQDAQYGENKTSRWSMRKKIRHISYHKRTFLVGLRLQLHNNNKST